MSSFTVACLSPAVSEEHLMAVERLHILEVTSEEISNFCHSH